MNTAWMDEVTRNTTEKDMTIDMNHQMAERFFKELTELANEEVDNGLGCMNVMRMVLNWNDKYPNAEIFMTETEDGFAIEDDSYHYNEYLEWYEGYTINKQGDEFNFTDDNGVKHTAFTVEEIKQQIEQIG